MVFFVWIYGRTQALHSASNSSARIPQKPTSQTKPISLPIQTKKTIYFSRPEPFPAPGESQRAFPYDGCWTAAQISCAAKQRKSQTQGKQQSHCGDRKS